MEPLPEEQIVGAIEQVFAFYNAMPTGVTVSESGRIFVCYPAWGDNSPFTVAELAGGVETPYPSEEMNNAAGSGSEVRFVSVQSVVADGTGVLWILDTAAPGFAAPDMKEAKLVAVDLATNAVKRVYSFGQEALLDTTYLNDVRIDYRRGSAGVAYITDSSARGPGGIIVVDLDTGRSFRRLSGTASVSADQAFLPKVEGQVMMNRPAAGESSRVLLATDGIALSPDGSVLYYCPLSSRHLYSIETKALLDSGIPDEKLAEMVHDWGEKGASDGMATAADGVVYASDYENNSIRAILPDGTMRTIVHDPRVLWPDTLSIGPDGYLYFIANQLHRQPGYNNGQDLRKKPYSLFKVKINAGPAATR